MNLVEKKKRVQRLIGAKPDAIFGHETLNLLWDTLEEAGIVESEPFTLIIDKGHADGTSASFEGVSERDITHLFASDLREELLERQREAGKNCFNIEIVDFPELSNKADLSATVEQIETLDPSKCLVLSLHCNVASNEQAKGAEVLYRTEKSKAFASRLATEASFFLDGRATPLRYRDDLFLLNSLTSYEVALLELGFLSNERDRARLLSEAGRELYAKLVSHVIFDYVVSHL